MKKEKDNGDVLIPDTDDTSYNDIPDYCGYCPDCPNCGDTMGYSYIESEFKCPSCGTKMDEGDWDYKSEEEDDEDPDDIPFECKACGGPYPNCKISCKHFDD